MSNTGIDYKQFVDIATKLNIMNIENQESMIDGSSISLLTAKLNAFISLYMIGKDDTCKRQFIELWKSQYVELNRRKNESIIKIFNAPEILTVLGISGENKKEFIDTVMETYKNMESANNDLLDIMLNSIDKAVI